jgi:hypothetical protein
MPSRRTLLAPLAALALLSPRGAPAEDAALGTLFYSPAQRLVIAKARRQDTEPGASEGVIRFDGAIASRRGLTSAWVNGRELELADQSGNHSGAHGLSVLQGQTVHLAPGLSLKVGQSAVAGDTARPDDLVPQGSVVKGGHTAPAPLASLAASANALRLIPSNVPPARP